MMVKSRNELLQRTMANYRFIKQAEASSPLGGSAEIYETTQLVNSFLMTLLQNWDELEKDWPHIPQAGLRWPSIKTSESNHQGIKGLRYIFHEPSRTDQFTDPHSSILVDASSASTWQRQIQEVWYQLAWLFTDLFDGRKKEMRLGITVYVRRWDEFVPETDDLSFLILKGHLIVEEVLSELLSKFLPNPQYLDQSRMKFASKVAFVRALCPHDADNTAWSLILALNKTRNELVHNLEPAKLEKLLESLFSTHMQVEVIPSSVGTVDRSREHLHGPSQRLRWAMFDCMRFLAGFSLDREEE